MPKNVLTDDRKQEILENLHSLKFAGYTRKEIRELTGIPERTQRRFIAERTNLKPQNLKRVQILDYFEEELKINLADSKYENLIDIKEHGVSQENYYKYKKFVNIPSKSPYRKYKGLHIDKSSYSKMKVSEIKKLTGKDDFFIKVHGTHKVADSTEAIPFQYTSKSIQGRKRLTKKDLELLDEFISNMLEDTDDYTDAVASSITIVRTTKIKPKGVKGRGIKTERKSGKKK